MAFVAKMSEKPKSTSSSAIQVKIGKVSIAEKLDVISQLKKSEGIIGKCCNNRFAPINLRTFVDKADEITEGAKSGTKAFNCVA